MCDIGGPLVVFEDFHNGAESAQFVGYKTTVYQFYTFYQVPNREPRPLRYTHYIKREKKYAAITVKSYHTSWWRKCIPESGVYASICQLEEGGESTRIPGSLVSSQNDGFVSIVSTHRLPKRVHSTRE